MEGIREDTFSQGLGQRTNNQEKILWLLKACQIAHEKGIKENTSLRGVRNFDKDIKLRGPLQQSGAQQDTSKAEIHAPRLLFLSPFLYSTWLKYGSRRENKPGMPPATRILKQE